MLVVLDPVEDGVRNAADADLQAGAVGNFGRHVGADGLLDLRGFAELHRDRRHVAADRGGNLGFVDQAAAIKVGDGFVDLRDDHARRFHGRDGDVAADAVAAEAVLIGQ